MIMVFSKPKDKENPVPISNDDDDEDFSIYASLFSNWKQILNRNFEPDKLTINFSN